MAQETATELQTSQIHDDAHAANDDDEINEMDLTPPPVSVYDKVYAMAEKFAGTAVGQFATERGDRLLEMIEDTAKWSLPQDKSKEPLVRPFGWITFLALILTLRLTRIGLSVAALMIGNGPVSAHDMVYFIQTRRRKLRAIRLHGLKARRQRELEEQAMRSGSSGGGIVGKLRVLLSSAICRPGQLREPQRRIFIHRGREVGEDETAGKDRASTKRPRDNESTDHNLTFDQLLTKYANENSDDDSDFLPNADEDEDDSTSSSASSSDASDEADPQETKKKPEMRNPSNDARAPDEKPKLDRSVVITENGGDHPTTEKLRPMPKPMIEIKKEVLSDIDSGNEQQLQQQTPKTNGPSNGNGGGQETEAHKENNHTPTATGQEANGNKLHVRPNQQKQLKSTPGHESAAQARPAVMPALGSTATAGSPPDFNAGFKPVSILKNPIVAVTENDQNADAHSTPKSDLEDPESAESVDKNSSSGPKKQVQHQQQKQQQQPQHQNRYRGKNRR